MLGQFLGHKVPNLSPPGTLRGRGAHLDTSLSPGGPTLHVIGPSSYLANLGQRLGGFGAAGGSGHREALGCPGGASLGSGETALGTHLTLLKFNPSRKAILLPVR